MSLRRSGDPATPWVVSAGRRRREVVVSGHAPALVIAIDGPSGSGKSTVARGVAAALALRYLDTGAMYRAVTWLALHRQVELDDAEALTSLAEHGRLEVSTDPQDPRVSIDGADVTAAIRGPDVTTAVSAVSAVPGVRTAMVRRQREIIGSGGIVVEGRDIGTAVVPDAPVKVFLTADEDVRAQRRAQETAGAVTTTREAIARRDRLDSTRTASPLTRPADALEIDSSAVDAATVVDQVVARAKAVLRVGTGDRV